MKAYQNTTETRLALLEQSINTINETLKRIDRKFDRIDDQFARIDDQFAEMRRESRNQFRWIMGIIITLFGLPIIQNTVIHFWSH